MRHTSYLAAMQRRNQQRVLSCAVTASWKPYDDANRTNSTWLLGLGLLALLLCCGCKNPYSVYQHRHTGYDFCGEPNIAYYHYPHGSWFVPAQQTSTHCPTIVEAPFHGFQSTCWTQWPEPWSPCPPPGMCPNPADGEVIETPAHEVMPQPQSSVSQSSRQLATTVPQSNQRPVPIVVMTQKREPAASEINLPTRLHGKHGFSGPDDDASSSAVAIELPVESAQLDRDNRKPDHATQAKKEKSPGKRY